ncbi:sulfurtransferase [Bordetella hinzii]|uniref:tRNA uridine(34) hydroxylase n=1 Tax=Bordetella hinzii OH87 BAL007II TaxID=1331262 RepID=A0ABR4QWI1_9BORD|nr:sulfurtransferase [Bordetella hinzii]KCB22494.1 rhodanese-like protein [Bordetella hinzii OH87 BAL007II]KCB41931.1 rhodanese-like protein [Bordetella hinzii 5132]QDJ40738.1 sulfurtransferase [Bordetella hinzii]QDJ54207.1 sulfurtransferase [Bordetella hinzii]QII83768.1 sulfurtransferase [Bordetella hinzii]
MSIVNIAAYKFVSLPDTASLRELLQARADALALKGTILLAPEGINLFLAGAGQAIEDFLADLRKDSRFADLQAKYSLSDAVPFGKMRVRLKREIIRMNHPAIRPEAGRAPSVDARTLARWLEQGRDDEGREVVMLDTRNAFEVDVGTFRNAIDWRIERFTQFPDAVREHRAELEGKTVVSFCTGGIRCEKAAIFMGELGIDHVYQLEGGILKYFEETGGPGYDGACFVFDERVALDPALKPVASFPGASDTMGDRAGA